MFRSVRTEERVLRGGSLVPSKKLYYQFTLYNALKIQFAVGLIGRVGAGVKGERIIALTLP